MINMLGEGGKEIKFMDEHTKYQIWKQTRLKNLFSSHWLSKTDALLLDAKADLALKLCFGSEKRYIWHI